jgi:hypothetical protein
VARGEVEQKPGGGAVGRERGGGQLGREAHPGGEELRQDDPFGALGGGPVRQPLARLQVRGHVAEARLELNRGDPHGVSLSRWPRAEMATLSRR